MCVRRLSPLISLPRSLPLSPLSLCLAAVIMAEIKTGIFAKNVQKRLNRAQEKVRVAVAVKQGGGGGGMEEVEEVEVEEEEEEEVVEEEDT
ncbi:hypothetical protein D4764_15G0005100 [Takifugu flavidus]|uniref:Uncharacterized protein n=1 Tax=Takifugu flavidus TaxID=433684 RepID=A0A5C6P207_9TELE|nr:hypothetical protein D4764_15G0005100 [Takifugu flavidus]